MSQRATINGRSSARANVNKRRPGRGGGGGKTRDNKRGEVGDDETRDNQRREGGETRQEKSREGREVEKQGKRRPGGRGQGGVHVVHKEKKKQW